MTVNHRRPGLGKGLGELFQRTESPAADGVDASNDVDPLSSGATTLVGDTGSKEATIPAPAGSYFADLPLEAISPNPRQPRTAFDDDALSELVESIREVGLLQPIVVRPRADGQFELVMGERRWRASQVAGTETIPAIVRETDEHDLLRDALLENLHRTQLNPLEEAAAYQQMLDDFGCTQEELSSRIKRSRPHISNTIRLLRLPPTVQRRVAAGVLSAGHARALLVIEDPAAQERLAQRVVAEGLSVRMVEELVTLGETGAEPAGGSHRRTRPAAPQATELAGRLSDHFETRVKVDLGKSKGKITIDFATLSDLERIVALMQVPVSPTELSMS